MTKNKKEEPRGELGFYLSCEKVLGGVSVIVGGIMNVSDFSSQSVMLSGHSGRILITGRRLAMTVFENRSIEITGIVEDIRFIYGKT